MYFGQIFREENQDIVLCKLGDGMEQKQREPPRVIVLQREIQPRRKSTADLHSNEKKMSNTTFTALNHNVQISKFISHMKFIQNISLTQNLLNPQVMHSSGVFNVLCGLLS